MLIDLLKFQIKDGCGDKAAELFKRQMKNNLGDEGCLLSKSFRSTKNANEFYILLGWENPEAIERHLKTSHDLRFREDLDPFIAGPPEFFEWEEIV
jgi:quinol monooxygenase YgiN